MMRYKLALLDKNHRDLHAMGRIYTKLELDRPATKKVGNRDLKIPSRGAFVLRNKMVAVGAWISNFVKLITAPIFLIS